MLFIILVYNLDDASIYASYLYEPLRDYPGANDRPYCGEQRHRHSHQVRGSEHPRQPPALSGCILCRFVIAEAECNVLHPVVPERVLEPLYDVLFPPTIDVVTQVYQPPIVERSITCCDSTNTLVALGYGICET